MNRIDSILNLLSAPTSVPAQTTKTASAHTSPLDAAIENAIGNITGSTKVASADAGAASPVADLMKLSNEVREADEDGEVKLARRMGSAFTDGMVERAELYRQHAAELDKTAGYRDERQAVLEKFASEHPAQYAALVREGYFSETREKSGAEEAADFDAGFVEKAAEIHAQATSHFIAGYAALEQALQG